MDQNAMRLTEDQVILDTVMSISSLLTALETNEELAGIPADSPGARAE